MHALFVATLILIRRRRRRRNALIANRKRRFWVRPLNVNRLETGAYYSLIKRMREVDREQFFKFVRMSPERFDHLIGLVEPYIRKDDSVRATIQYNMLLCGAACTELPWCANSMGTATMCLATGLKGTGSFVPLRPGLKGLVQNGLNRISDSHEVQNGFKRLRPF